MDRVGIALSLLFLSSLSLAADGKIHGTLVDDAGLPVPHMGVQATPTDIGHSGSLPSATTDEHGRFVITIRSVSKRTGEHWAVYPYSRVHGFHPQPRDFYRNDVPEPPIVELSPKVLDASVELKLGPPVAALIINVSGVHGPSIERSFDVAWASDPSKNWGITYSVEESPYRLLIPANTNLTLTVISQGFEKWHNAGVISVGAGQESEIDIELQPTKEQK